jgi:hypothetical protein
MVSFFSFCTIEPAGRKRKRRAGTHSRERVGPHSRRQPQTATDVYSWLHVQHPRPVLTGAVLWGVLKRQAGRRKDALFVYCRLHLPRGPRPRRTRRFFSLPSCLPAPPQPCRPPRRSLPAPAEPSSRASPPPVYAQGVSAHKHSHESEMEEVW